MKPRIYELDAEVLEIAHVSRHENQTTLSRGCGQKRIDRSASDVRIERSDTAPSIRDYTVDRNRSTRKGCRDPFESVLEIGAALVIGLHVDAAPNFA